MLPLSLVRSAADRSPALGIDDSPPPPQPRAGEIALTQGQKLALLVMRGSDLSKQVLAGVIEKTHDGPAGRDFRTCAQLGLAINKGRFHVLTPAGRWRADRIMHDIARQFGLHILTYNLGGYGQAASVQCTCGHVTYKSRSLPSYALLIRQAGAKHLAHVAEQKTGHVP